MVCVWKESWEKFPSAREVFESLGVAGQPRHSHAAHAGHVRRGHLTHAARTGHPGADAPVLEAAAQRPRAG